MAAKFLPATCRSVVMEPDRQKRSGIISFAPGLPPGKSAARQLEQWQIEVTGGGRIWYCLDKDNRKVWVVLAGTGHPRATG